MKIIFFSILLLSLLLRIYYFVGVNINDDVVYSYVAHELTKGNFHVLHSGSLIEVRSMMGIPIAFFYKILGPGEISSSLWPLLCSLGMVALTFLIGKKLFDETTALLGAFFMSVLPLNVLFAAQLVPDVPQTFLMCLGTYLFILGDDHRKAFSKKDGLYFLFSGLIFGLAWLCNEKASLSLFIIIAFLIERRSFSFKYLLSLLGSLIIFLAEASFMYKFTGNPLWRPQIINESLSFIGMNEDLTYYPTIFFKLKNLNFQGSEGITGIFAYLTVLAMVVLLFLRKKNALFLSLWILLIYGYLQYGIMSMTDDGIKLIGKWIRYIEVIALPSMLLIACFLTSVRYVKRAYLPVAILIFLSSFYYLNNLHQAFNIWTYDYKQIYSFLRSQPEKTIYIDQGSSCFLEIYSGYRWRIKILEYSKREEIRDSYVVLYANRGIIECPDARSSLPEYALNPPPEWKLLTEIKGPDVEVYGKFDPLIYYAPP